MVKNLSQSVGTASLIQIQENDPDDKQGARLVSNQNAVVLLDSQVPAVQVLDTSGPPGSNSFRNTSDCDGDDDDDDDMEERKS